MAVIKDKILVIEDEKSINYLIGTVLTANGYDVIKAYTGTEACQMLDAYCPDLIILDLGLPRYGWSGYHPTYSRVERCSNYSGICQDQRTRQDRSIGSWRGRLSDQTFRRRRTAGAYPHRSAPYQDASRRSWIGAYRDLPVWPAAESILTAIWYGWEKRTCI